MDRCETVRADNAAEIFADVDGILVPGGFGNRGIEGKIQAVRYAREHKIPYLGLCLGMQVAVIEFAKNVIGWADANSGEFSDSSTHKVIDFMPGQSDEIDKGGTLRLGSWPCTVVPGTFMAKCYGNTEIAERHRHRYELNNTFREELVKAGLVISGTSPDGRLVETVE
jgi:CTP synthase